MSERFFAKNSLTDDFIEIQATKDSFHAKSKTYK